MTPPTFTTGPPQPPEHTPDRIGPDRIGVNGQVGVRVDGERGSVAVEMMLVASLLVLVMLLVVTCGRLAFARLRLDDVAHQAARAASLARDPATARHAATSTTASALAVSGASCATHSVSVDTSGFAPGGSVTVTVSCTTNLRDVSGLHLPGTMTQSVAFTSVVDSFRGTTTDPT